MDRRRELLAALWGALLILAMIYAPPWSDDGVTVAASATTGDNWGVDFYAGKELARPASDPQVSADGRRRTRIGPPRLGSRAGCPNAANTPGGADGNGGCWPYAGNTGIPAGTSLTTFTGDCEIRTDNTVLDSYTFNCAVVVYAANVVVKNSKVNGVVFVNAPTASVTVQDSEVDGGSAQFPTVGDRNATVLRSNVYGGQHGVQCYGSCTVTDSWLHDMYPGGKALDWHENAFISNGGSNMTIQHTSMFCTGGCTADLALIPDDNLSNITINNNLFVASPDSAYCLYGGGTTGGKPGTNDHIVVTNNIWQYGTNNLCASFGPATSFNPGNTGNTWTNNKWTDGATVSAPSS